MADGGERDRKHDQIVRGQDDIKSLTESGFESINKQLSDMQITIEQQSQMKSSSSKEGESGAVNKIKKAAPVQETDQGSTENETSCNTTQGKNKLSKADSLRRLWDFDLNFGDRLSEALDVKYTHAKYWRHLAQEFGIKPITYEAFSVSDITSPTERLLEHLHTTQPNYKVKDFCQDCKTVDAIEVYNILENKIKAGTVNNEDLVRKMFDKAPDVLDEVVLKLDREERLWKNLARKRSISSEKIEAFEFDSTTNPARDFFNLLKTEAPYITVGNFKENCRALKLELIPEFLKTSGVTDDTMFLRNLSRVSPDVKRQIEHFLNKNLQEEYLLNLAHRYRKREGLMKDIDLETAFGPQQNTHSPTRQVMKYVLASLPQYTIEDLINKLYNINRKECFSFLAPYLIGGMDDIDEITRRLQVEEGSVAEERGQPSTSEDRDTSGIPASDESVNPYA